MLKLTECHLIQFPSGKWGFVGRVPVELMFDETPERIAKMLDASCPQFLKTKAFATEADAQAALDNYNRGKP